MSFVTTFIPSLMVRISKMPFIKTFISPLNFSGLTEVVRMTRGGLLTPCSTGYGYCWVRGSEPAPSFTVVSVSTSTALRGAKKLRIEITYGCVATALSDFVEQRCFLAVPGSASSEEFVPFRLRRSRNSP